MGPLRLKLATGNAKNEAKVVNWQGYNESTNDKHQPQHRVICEANGEHGAAIRSCECNFKSLGAFHPALGVCGICM
jgi:hypothetical protein